LDVKDLDYIFITHFHTDHINDLLMLVFNQKINFLREIKPVKNPKIFGPEGIEEVLKELDKVGHLNSREKKGPEVAEISKMIDLTNMKVTPFMVKHYHDLQSYAYRFEIEGKTITFSGDSAMCDGIIEAAKEADIFFVDSSWPKSIKRDDHLNTIQVGEVATEANAKLAVLIHLKKEGFGKDLVSEVKEAFDGEVLLAQDLMEIEL
jgi:ribonuclease BN (tRNA processing enzyme)